MTLEDIQNHLQSHLQTAVKPRLRCKDGYTVSVQASEFHYCTPRNNTGPYTKVEVGYPSSEDEELGHYGDDGWGSDVYAYVPVEVVVAIINKHGGLVCQGKLESHDHH